jgi:preprotein translocase subunit SecA
MKQLISTIKSQAHFLLEKTEEELGWELTKLKKQVGISSLESILPYWFALVQEMSFRHLGLRHFDTQLLAGLVLHEGKIVEMKTGEGKTLASTLAISLNALEKKGVHVVTVNDYLAERDEKWMGKLYSQLDLSSGLVKTTSSLTKKKKNYAADITYVTNSELVFDFLRDSTSSYKEEKVQRPFHYCIIDEIDAILIDEARTPLILSSSQPKNRWKKLFLAKELASELEKEKDFELDEKKRDIHLTEQGYEKAKAKLGKKSLYESRDPWILEVLNALKAQYLFKLNKDYIVLEKKVIIVDELTGRIMEDRRWNLGIHEAVEMKENLPLGGGTKTKSAITYQNFFPLYPKLAGMTGTGKTAEKEFEEIYNLKVVVIPTWKPLLRKDLSDLVYPTELAKWKAVVQFSNQSFIMGQPLLIGTSSVEKSEFLSDLFHFSKIPHEVLNAKPENVKRESEIIAQAGKIGAVTIATNLAGRGTDIILGGNPSFAVKKELEEAFFRILSSSSEEKDPTLIPVLTDYEKNRDFSQLEKEIQNLPFSLESALPSLRELFEKIYEQRAPEWKKEQEKVKQLGGLIVLGTERHETRRIDNQLRGRAGRQGDPGLSQFFVSLEDELIQRFAGESLKGWASWLEKDDEALQSKFLTQTLEKAQQKVEDLNSDLRKNIFQYDQVLQGHRLYLFEGRKEIFEENFFHTSLLRLGERMKEIKAWVPSSSEKEFLDLSWKEIDEEEKWINIDLRLAESNSYELGFLKRNRSVFFLTLLDQAWTDHLEKLNYIRETISWRAYGQQNPLAEYNLEGFQSFTQMLEEINSSMLYYGLENSLY